MTPDPKPTGLAAELIDAEAAARPRPAPAGSPLGRFVLAVSLVLVAFNLRPVFSSLAAVLPEVRAATGATPATASLLTTVPVLCLGLFAGTAPRLAHRFGAERVILALALLLTAGTALRGLGSVPALLVGSVLAGGSIAVVNVLLPGLVKRDFPDRVATVTAFYTMALCAGAAAAAGATVPFERATGSGWPGALAAWAVPAGAVTLIWAPQAVRPKAPDRPRAGDTGPALLRQPLAWQVTGFMGLQSALAYCIFGWFAPLLRARGLDAATAGYVVSFSVLAQTAACLIAPGLATRGRSQSAFNVGAVVLAVVGFLGALFAPLPTVWLWAGLQGLGQGSLIAVALTLIVLRAPDVAAAARLSSMAQGFGYSIAAFGPLVTGYLFTATGQPGATAPLIVLLGCGAAASGWYAGRDRVLAGR